MRFGAVFPTTEIGTDPLERYIKGVEGVEGQ